MKGLFSARAVLLPIGFFLAFAAHAAPPERILSGDLLVANIDHNGVQGSGIVKVDPVTGNQTVLSKGGYFLAPNDVVVGPDRFYVTDSGAFNNVGAVLSVGLQSKKQAVVTSGGLLRQPTGIAIEANGQLLVVSGNNIVRVDPGTGQQSLVSMVTGQAWRAAVENTGEILVTIVSSPPQILRIEPITGAQSVVSAGGLLRVPFGLAIASNGDIIVLNAGTDAEPGDVVRVDPVSGAQSVISSGGFLLRPEGLAVASNDDIFVVDVQDPLNGKVIRIDPTTGAQSFLSVGGRLLAPEGICVAP